MNEIKWIKMATDFFSDEQIQLIEQMPDGDCLLVIWIKILCLTGRSNASGVLMMTDRVPYTDDILSVIFRRPIAVVRNALKVFEQFGMIVVVNNTITIPTWAEHQNLEGMEKIRADTRQRVAEYRARQRLLLSVNVEQY